MLNSYSSGGKAIVHNSIKVNAVTGNILKNYRRSFFKRFKLDSDLAKQLFDEQQPHLLKLKTKHWEDSSKRVHSYTEEEKQPVVIIQMMMCGESEVLAELMWQDDFDAMFE